MDELHERGGADDPEVVLQGQTPIRPGVLWNTAGQLASRVAMVIFGLVLARALDPESFGLFGLANSVLAVGLVFSDIGVGQALIQRQGDIRENASAAFYMNLTAVGLFAAAMIALSGTVARFYGQGVVRPLLMTMALAFFIRGAAAVHEAFLRKQMRFRRQQVMNLSGVVVYGATAVGLAIAGAGPWSLALGVLAGNVTYAVLVFAKSGMPLSRSLHRERWRGLIAFGGVLFVSSILWTLVVQGDNLAVGKLLGPEALGAYVVAYSFGALPVITIGGAVAQVMYSAFSRVQDDLGQLAGLLFKSIRAIALVSLPCAVVALFVARDALLLFLGDRWAPAAVPFQVFLVMFTMFMFVSPMPVVYLARNRPIVNLLFAAGTLPVLIVAIAVGYPYGIAGVAIGVSVMMALHNAVHVVVTSRMLHVRVFSTLRQVAPPAAAAGAALVISGLLFLSFPDLPYRSWVAGAIAIPVAIGTLRLGFRTAWGEGMTELRLMLRQASR